MTHGPVSHPITKTITLGQDGYGDTLLITDAGAVVPSLAGANAIVAAATLASVRISNKGMVQGGTGAAGVAVGGSGGMGMALLANATVSNHGIIAGGDGGVASETITGQGGAGGVGVDLAAGGSLTNFAAISGGSGGMSPSYAGNHAFASAGGAGVTAEGAATIKNQGSISGGNASDGYVSSFSNPEKAGTGVDLSGGGLLINSGTISGGRGGDATYATTGGLGVLVGDADDTIRNSGTIDGGMGGNSDGPGRYSGDGSGGSGIQFSNVGTLINSGMIAGAAGGYHSTSGSGVDLLQGGTVSNAGTILGGDVGYASGFGGGYGIHLGGAGSVTNHGLIQGGSDLAYAGASSARAGVQFTSGGTLSNDGTIFGGHGSIMAGYASGGLGGDGVVLGSSGILRNAGSIAGGAGSYSAYPSYVAGGDGGAGVLASAGDTISNIGTILGGAGGFSQYGHPGTGGVGIQTATGVSLTNSGTIAGGAGGDQGAAFYKGGDGGAGVLLNGGMLVNHGTIAGGAGGHSAAGDGADGVAVKFGSTTATLVVDPGAVFNGAIVANLAVTDVLELAAQGVGALAGFGTTITGFQKITEDAQATWTLTGAITGGGVLDIGQGAILTQAGPVSIASVAFAAGGSETLRLTIPAETTSKISGFIGGDCVDLVAIKASSLSYADGTLTVLGAGQGDPVVATLRFAGAYTTADFGLHVDGHGGSDIVFSEQQAGAQSGSRLGNVQAQSLSAAPSRDGLAQMFVVDNHSHGCFV